MDQISAQSPATNTRLGKPWLIPARVLWLIASLIALGLFILGLPLRAEDIDGWYRGGIQTTFSKNPKNEIVLSPWPGYASTRVGVLEGDILLTVNDVPVTSVQQADSLLAGAIGTPVNVSVRTGNFPPRQLTVTRDSVEGRILLRYGLSSQFAVIFVLASEILFTILCMGIASVIFWYRSDDWMALLSSLVIAMILVGLSLPVLSFGQSRSGSQDILMMNIWYALAFGFLFMFFYLFPSGQFASPLTLALAVVLGLWMTLGLFNFSLYPWNLPRLSYALVIIGWACTGMFALVYRYRYSNPLQRQQIRWIIWGAIASVLGLIIQIIPQNFGLSGSTRVLYDFVLYPLGQLLKALLPLSIGFAILRYRLWDIHIIINRSLVYGTLTLTVIILYIAGVGGLSALFQTRDNPLISFAATGMIAIAVQPLQQRFQRGVNRLMYGERDDPYAVLARLSGALETTPTADEVLPIIAFTIGQTLKIPYVAILLDRDGEKKLVASHGSMTSDLLSFPLIFQGETIGSLQLAHRSEGEEFSSADKRLIENIARQAGAAAQSVRLNSELVRSRAQIVNEREEERIRIRRDLHDELGPILASQGLKLAAARQLIRSHPEKAEALVDDIIQHSQQTVTDIRRLVHGLRPPALDQLGLVEAIRDFVQNNGSDDLASSGLDFNITSPEGRLTEMPAAIEVNAYRIVLEALSNVARHAQAKHCFVRFLMERDELQATALIIQISDDGTGMTQNYRAGVGLRSMRERAEEVGGQFSVEPAQPSGTLIIARLPFKV